MIGEKKRGSSISTQWAALARKLGFNELPSSVIDAAKLHYLDTLGICLASHPLPYARAIRQAVSSWGGKRESSVLLSGEKLPMHAAALINGSLAHGLDFDDTHTPSITHPSACIVPTALAVGEAASVNGKELITASVLGWEFMARLGMAAPGGFHAQGYHATPLLGTFASALVAGRLLRLSLEAMVNALGICGSQAAGLQQFVIDGTWVKRLHPGWAAHSGVAAAQMAAHGLTGPGEIFEGIHGLFATHLRQGSYNLRPLTEGLGRRWETTQISFKPYPCCHLNHSYIDCILKLKKEHALSPEKIESIQCMVAEGIVPIVCEPVQIKKRPPTPYGAQFSLPYAVAAALVRGKVTMREFTMRSIKETKLLALARKVKYSLDENSEHPKHFPGWVRITTKGGEVHEARQRYNRGGPNYPISAEEVMKKFHGNVEGLLPVGRAEKLAGAIMNLEKLENCAELVRMTRGR